MKGEANTARASRNDRRHAAADAASRGDATGPGGNSPDTIGRWQGSASLTIARDLPSVSPGGMTCEMNRVIDEQPRGQARFSEDVASIGAADVTRTLDVSLVKS